MNNIQIYILSKNRCDYLCQALDSVLTSSGGSADIVVSDNSESDSIRRLVINDYPNVTYAKRDPPMSVFDHYRTVIQESTAEYLVIFHDDDLMMPAYVRTMTELLDTNPHIAAVGCNALVLRGDERTEERVMGPGCKRALFAEPVAVLNKYLEMWDGNPAPFPGYMYRRKYLVGLYLDPEHGGKYSDVSFLMKLNERGSILWIPEPLMWYRRHAGNDSGTESIANRLSLLRYVFTHAGIDRSAPEVRDFKFRYWVFWWMQRVGKHPLSLPRTWRERVIWKFLLVASIKAFLYKPYFRSALIGRIFR